MKQALMKVFTDLGLQDVSTGEKDHHGRERRRNGLFSQRRSNIGKAYGLSGEIRELSKQAIDALFLDKSEFADFYLHEMGERFRELCGLDLPADIAWQMQAEAGQELVEAHFVKVGYAVIVKNEPMPTEATGIPTPQKLGVTEPCWLAGIGDAVTELSRVVGKVLLKKDLSRSERLALRERYVEFASSIHEVLSELENASPLVVNNSRRRGYRNTYRGLLGRIRGAISHHEEKLADLYDRSAMQ